MGKRLRSRLLVYLLVAACPGCAVFEKSRPAPILIRDAETKQPIAGAEVAITYPLSQGFAAPSRSAGVTNADGIVRLQAVPAGDISIVLDASAKGYLSEWKDLSSDEVRQV